jgi:pimeloyl-ACP methyl ester carboxylesterase
LSLHSSWAKTDHFVKTVVESWQIVAKAVGVQEMIIRAIFPWCLTPELYAEKPEYIESLAAFVRSRPPQEVTDFVQQSNAVLTHDVEAQLGQISAPTQITFGRHDQITSARLAERLTAGIRGSELVIFEGCAHAALYENVAEFNQKTLAFLQRHTGAAVV